MITALFSIVFIALLIMILCLLKNKEYLSRIVSVNCITSYTVVVLSMLVVLGGIETFFLDIAVVYGALGFISSIAFLKFFRGKRG